MDFYCEMCDKTMKPKSKNNHPKSLTHKQYAKCFRKKRSINSLNFFDIEKIFNVYIIYHNKKFDLYLINCEFI